MITILDKLGRRKLAIGGGIAMGIPHAILAGLVATYNTSWTENAGVAWFAVALVYIYVLMYSVTYGPLGWCLPAEVSSGVTPAIVLPLCRYDKDKSLLTPPGLVKRHESQGSRNGRIRQLDREHHHRE